MEKTITKEEIERVLERKFGQAYPKSKERILNELFPQIRKTMNYKLKHLSRFCCTPETELEFETVKMAAELGGVDWYNENEFNDTIDYPFLWIDSKDVLIFYLDADGRQLISVLDFINKLRMTEEEAEKLEDDRVEFAHANYGLTWEWAEHDMVIKALNGHYFKLNEDSTEVTLHKR